MKAFESDVTKYRDGLRSVDQQFIKRWSQRSMSGQGLSKDQMKLLVEAARWSPSCFNLQVSVILSVQLMRGINWTGSRISFPS